MQVFPFKLSTKYISLSNYLQQHMFCVSRLHSHLTTQKNLIYRKNNYHIVNYGIIWSKLLIPLNINLVFIENSPENIKSKVLERFSSTSYLLY